MCDVSLVRAQYYDHVARAGEEARSGPITRTLRKTELFQVTQNGSTFVALTFYEACWACLVDEPTQVMKPACESHLAPLKMPPDHLLAEPPDYSECEDPVDGYIGHFPASLTIDSE